MKGHVICGVDGSGVAAGAIEVARELARRHRLPLVYVHVVDGAGGSGDPNGTLHDAIASGDAEVAFENGHPADRLVALAHEREASFLVVGNHGERSSLLGSISADVSRRAPCPVVVVPPTAAATIPQADAGRRPRAAGGAFARS